MGERKTGLGSLPTGLLRPTTPPEPVIAPEPAEEPDAAAESAESQGRGSAEEKSTRTRSKRQPASGPSRGRKLHLPDTIHDRLWLLARQRRKTVSAVAAEILDRNLPRFKVEREG